MDFTSEDAFENFAESLLDKDFEADLRRYLHVYVTIAADPFIQAGRTAFMDALDARISHWMRDYQAEQSEARDYG